jgi:alkylation response protein AidB-like acyl-CoA dehydrogenase
VKLSSFLHEMYAGRFRWDLIHPFPTPLAADWHATDSAIAAFTALSSDGDGTGLPEGLVAAMISRGLTKAHVTPELGGLGLSPWGTFQLVASATARSLPAGMVIAAENAFGLGALLPHLPPGPLRDELTARVATGVLSGLADTEPHGASNLEREMTIVEDGDELVLTGEKLFVSNAPIAEVLTFSATLDGRRRLVVVDTPTAGMRVTRQQFMGLEGFPIGRVVCDEVRTPRMRLVPESTGASTRITAEAVAMVRTGKAYFTAAPSLALARQLLGWAAEYVRARRVDRVPLASFDEVQRRLAESAADVYAIEAVTDWALLTPHTASGPTAWLERSATKNAVTALAGRLATRLLPVLAGEGYETSGSKRSRGAERAFGVERAFRDLLAFRIAGGVDFHVDHQFASMLLETPQARPASAITGIGACLPSTLADLVVEVADRVAAFGALSGKIAARQAEVPTSSQRQLIELSTLATELMVSSVVLSRAARAGEGEADLAALYCAGALQRMDDLWDRVGEPAPTYDVSRIAQRVLADPGLPHARPSQADRTQEPA